MANNLYGRSKAMSSRPVVISTIPHPSDRYLLSQPEWEEYDGEGRADIETLDQAQAVGLPLPQVPGVVRLEALSSAPSTLKNCWSEGVRLAELEFWDLSLLPLVRSLREYDALLAVQSPYLAYLSGRPYVATQMGGDIWYECSRDDTLGRLQRRAFAQAGAFMMSNPWSPAFARRYGLHNLVYVPYMIDEDRYSPGPGDARTQWRLVTGGEFFVLLTSRQDFRFKGSDIAIRAFARFAAEVPQARLVVTGWGADQSRAMDLFRQFGIAERVHLVPVVGKKRLVDYLRSADCVLDQLSIGYFGASALEAMACGRPVIMNLNQAQYDALIPEGCAPICQAADEQQVLERLRHLHDYPDHARACGESLRRWFLRTHDNRKWARINDAILLGSARGCLPSFDDSPLRQPCDTYEEAYHSAELAAAPPFPNYF